MRSGVQLNAAFGRGMSRRVIYFGSSAESFLACSRTDLNRLIPAALEAHANAIEAGGACLLKNAPESAVTRVNVSDGSAALCVKEFKWRNSRHAAKGLIRATQAIRSFRNGERLNVVGIGVARPLALIRETVWGIALREWFIMEAPNGAVELDRRMDGLSAGSATGRSHLMSAVAVFLGRLHNMGIFHSDLKTCNIMVVGSCDIPRPQDLRLVDYDNVTFFRSIPSSKAVKNLCQLFLSTPVSVGSVERMRFLNTYAQVRGLDRQAKMTMAGEVLRQAAGRGILYVGRNGDVSEEWERMIKPQL